MSRNLWLVPLLLATAVVLADDAPETERVAGATEAEVPDDAPETTRVASATEADRSDSATEADAQTEKGPKAISGMSILGNQEAPKSLVIVPWKSSEIGESLGISRTLDDSRQPVDKEVFMRALSYYEIRSKMTP